MELIKKYFPELNGDKIAQFEAMNELYHDWNEKINVVSRKDIEELYERHILHSLAIAKIIQFKPGTKVLDVGTGGGFPGIPLAVLFPETEFLLIDSIGKKIKVVNAVAEGLGLKNVSGQHIRVQSVKEKYDFVVSRAVTAFPDFVNMVRKNISRDGKNSLPNGIIYLKGGDFSDEIKKYRRNIDVTNIPDFFSESFFETKKIVYLPI
jgi:16S rRNA (guanine527-N7)-methyltransferase